MTKVKKSGISKNKTRTLEILLYNCNVLCEGLNFFKTLTLFSGIVTNGYTPALKVRYDVYFLQRVLPLLFSLQACGYMLGVNN